MSKKRGNGEGTLYKDLKKGVWVGEFSYRDLAGAWHRPRVTAKTRRECSEKLAEARVRHLRGLEPHQAAETVTAYLERWILGLPDRLRPTTRADYAHRLREHVIPYLGHVRLRELTVEHVEEWKRTVARGKKGGKVPAVGYVHGHHAVLRKALNDAVRRKLVDINVASLAGAPPEPTPVDRSIPLEDMSELVRGWKHHPQGNLFETLLGTGLRISEAIGLTWSRVDLEAETILVDRQVLHDKGGGWHFDHTKNRRLRTLPLPTSVSAALRRQSKQVKEQKIRLGTAWTDLDFVFPNEVGTPEDRDNIAKRLARLCKDLGIPRYTPHQFRHSNGTYLLLKKVQPAVISRNLGHSSVAFTLDTYAHVLPELQRESAEEMDGVLSDLRRKG